ncbi:hypothetical protein AB0N92_06350 [Streptomyces sp. NPDC093248]|uniref:hypothetical protein n=1 Tax=Streptomyces sp. NPDC093248 TaxID=3155072 RepID=UPI00343FBE66
MSNEQRDQHPAQEPPAPQTNPRREFIVKAVLAASGATVSALVRAAWDDLLGRS